MTDHLIAFHGKQSIKNKYVNRVKAHQAADEIIHGKYWEDGKGCAVGCTVHSNKHLSYETELGVPLILAWLEDKIFESLDNGRAKEWPLQFLQAIPVGADLFNVWPQFAVWLLVDEQWGVLQFAEADRTQKAIAAVAEFYKSGKFGKREHYDEISKIRETAADAAGAAADAAWAATGDVWAAAGAARAAWAAGAAARAAAAAAAAGAADAAGAAGAAAAAAAAAADAAGAAADAADAAKQKWLIAHADKLLELMRQAPVLIEVSK